jgi:hypothetical protein
MTKGGATIPAEAQESLKRLLSSDSMVRAPRVRGVLNYVVDRMLAGEGSTINEQTIGQAVFGRPEGYSRGDDNIVRVTVRHLRARLEEYYSNEGRNEAWVFEIPKGNYVPVLRSRVVPSPVGEAPAPLAATAVAPPAPPIWQRLAPWLLSAVFLATALISAALWYGQWHPPSAAGAGLAQELLAGAGQQLSIITTDANLQLYRMMFQKTVPLSDYIARRYLQLDSPGLSPPMLGALSFIRSGNETSLASSQVALRLQRANSGSTLRIRHPRELAMRDFQQDNLILLGGPWINPWGQLFEDRLNFRLMPPKEDASRSQVENLKPQSGEQPLYQVHGDGAFSVGYARVAMLPNLTDTGRVILVGATDNGSVEAGGRFLVEPGALKELLDRFHASGSRDLPSFEVILEVRSVDSTPRAFRVVASRVVTAPR